MLPWFQFETVLVNLYALIFFSFCQSDWNGVN